jgi:hypothetical protein
MKRITIAFLVAALAIVSCSKMKESPDPSTITNGQSTGGGNSGGGNSGGGGNPDVYIGLWKLVKTTEDGVEVTPDSTFEVRLGNGGNSDWTWFRGGVQSSAATVLYSLNTSQSPAIAMFTMDNGTREIVSKTGTQLVWKYAKPSSAITIQETLTKQ